MGLARRAAAFLRTAAAAHPNPHPPGVTGKQGRTARSVAGLFAAAFSRQEQGATPPHREGVKRPLRQGLPFFPSTLGLEQLVKGPCRSTGSPYW